VSRLTVCDGVALTRFLHANRRPGRSKNALDSR
jgi:hypothetical protein